VDNAIRRHAIKGQVKTTIRPHSIPLTSHNVKGEYGFSALGGVQQASTAGGADLEPPDQGLCAGGGYVMEFINNALVKRADCLYRLCGYQAGQTFRKAEGRRFDPAPDHPHIFKPLTCGNACHCCRSCCGGWWP
jgi:hypothetical protein